MVDMNTPPRDDAETEQFPLEPRYHPVNRVARRIYDSLASAKLAMFLLVSILLCCLGGVTVYRGDRATEMIFGTLWFNGLLVLLVVNTACCFFGRIWGRRITVISFGMILFHLSFVGMFLAIVFNSLFYFEGFLRLTEGETLSNRDPKSYDGARHGLFFSYPRLKGETTLQRVHRGFKVDGMDRHVAYEVSVADGGSTIRGTIYTNNKFVYRGVEYIRDREGFSLLAIVNDNLGKELYGVFIPLQSYKQKDESIIYGTGTRFKEGLINFPPESGRDAYFDVQLSYYMDNSPGKDRNGRVRFQVWPPRTAPGGHGAAQSAGPTGGSGGHTGNPPAGGAAGMPGGHTGNPPAGGASGMPGGHTGGSPTGMMGMVSEPLTAPVADSTLGIGETLSFSRYQLFVPEVRYWVGMNVNYNPGKPFVLASLVMGLAGIIITTVGRMVKQRR